MPKPAFWSLPIINMLLWPFAKALSWLHATVAFKPVRLVKFTPADIGIGYEDVYCPTADGETLHGWYVPSSAPKNDHERHVLFFHGQFGNISHQLPTIKIFHSLGYSLLIIDYRGYGKSTGKPNMDGVFRDAETSWHWLRKNKNIPAEQIAIVGRSLGGSIAASLACQVTPAALVLESSFNSIYEILRSKAWWLYFSRPFIYMDFSIKKFLEKATFPLFVIHSVNDERAPIQQGKMIYDSYAGPKEFLSIHGSHDSGFLQSKEAYTKGLCDFLQAVFDRQNSRADIEADDKNE